MRRFQFVAKQIVIIEARNEQTIDPVAVRQPLIDCIGRSGLAVGDQKRIAALRRRPFRAVNGGRKYRIIELRNDQPECAAARRPLGGLRKG